LVPATRAADALGGTTSDAGTVLVHANDRRVDHLYRCVVIDGEAFHHPVPHAALRHRTNRL
jgi:hypothetical protein